MPKPIKNWSTNQRRFQEWLALPASMREPRHQGELAQVLRVNDSTLSRWKRLERELEDGRTENFQEAVNKIARRYLDSDLPEVFGALREKAREGSHQHIKLYLELDGEYVERRELTGEGGGPIIFLPGVIEEDSQE